ncbi:HAMP domain-containing sensor histidine kinase [Longispora sp. NPDC051575]|uniref:sensor histidine kinase n=1 Tax=Longispora sp. NPDC051575 TaxID=3154943 RepID=UPI00344759FB
MRRTFVGVALAVTALVIVGFAVPLAWFARHTAAERDQSNAHRDADAIAAVLRVTTEPREVSDALAALPAANRGLVVVRLPDGRFVGPARGPRATPAQWTATVTGGRAADFPVAGGYTHVRPVAVADGEVAVAEVYVPEADTDRRVRTAWLGLLGLGAVLLVAAALLADRLARQVVRSSTALALAAERLGSGDLDVRVRPAGPAETHTAGVAFNAMAARIAALLAMERELVADLSHRLRTPLTVLRLNAASLPDCPARDRVVEASLGLSAEVDDIVARARRPLVVREAGSCDLAEVVAGRVAFWEVLAEDQDRPWRRYGLDAPVRVPVPAGTVQEVLDALLANVFHHTPHGAACHVGLRPDQGGVILAVDDAGPGIAEPALAVRRGVSGGRSTGLGLDIARRVAAEHGGSLSVTASPLGGARVALRLPTVSPGAGRPV